MDNNVPKLPLPEALRVGKILVVGDLMLDRYWFGRVERISPEAPVPVAKIASTEDRLGGAANVASNIAALGGNVSLLGIVGADDPGQTIQLQAQKMGIQTYLITDQVAPTTLKMRVLGGQQQLLRVDFEELPSVASCQVLQQTLSQIAVQFDVVVFSDYAKGTLKNIANLIQIARSAGCYVFVDPKGDDFTRYQGAHVLTPNRQELRHVKGRWVNEDEMTAKAFAVVREAQLEALLVTRSEEGMSLYQNGEVTTVAALAREVFDVSGAGDTVIATLALMVANAVPLKEAVELANLAGSVVVGKLGTSSIQYAELQAAWNEHFRS